MTSRPRAHGNDRRPVGGRYASPVVEALEARALLAGGITPSGVGTLNAIVNTPLSNVAVATFTVDSATGAPGTKWLAKVSWGDGTVDKKVPATLVSGNQFRFLDSHTYTSTGTFTVTVMIAVPNSMLPNDNTVTDTVVVSAAAAGPNAPALAPGDDTGVSQSDAITRHNGSPAAPLDFTVSGVSPANGFVRLFDGTTLVAGPTQATNGTALFTLAGTPLADGVHPFTATAAATSTGPQGPPSAATRASIQTSLRIAAVSPADGAFVPALPNGQVSVTFSHPIAGLTAGGPGFPANNPFALFLLARGPDLTFSAPSGVDAGDLPIHANTSYRVNGDGNATVTLTPLGPLATDVYGISIAVSSYSDLAGNVLTDAANGFRTFLLQHPPVNVGQPLRVTGVSEFNGFATINNNAVFQPDTIAIRFNKPLFAGAASGGKVQLIANPGPSFSVVPSVAAYSPTTQAIDLTPTALLTPGTVYAVRVDASVSDDQGLGAPGGALGQTFFDTFTVLDAPVGAGSAPFRVATDAQGNPQTLPASNVVWTAPVHYGSVALTEPLDPSSLGRFSAMLDPRAVGSDNNTALENVPLNARVAFNPNLNRLIIVPSQPVADALYVYSLSNMKAKNGDPLLNAAGQAAGTGGPPFFASFLLQSGVHAQVQTNAVSAGGAVSPLQGVRPPASTGALPALRTSPLGRAMPRARAAGAGLAGQHTRSAIARTSLPGFVGKTRHRHTAAGHSHF